MPIFYIVQFGKDNEWAIQARDEERCKPSMLLEVALSCEHIPTSAIDDELKASLCG
jgi:hypothetical protein